MKYTVEIVTNKGEGETAYKTGLSRKTAVATARAETQNANNRVYITWYRSTDGQRGYLNRDGNHAITGEAW